MGKEYDKNKRWKDIPFTTWNGYQTWNGRPPFQSSRIGDLVTMAMPPDFDNLRLHGKPTLCGASSDDCIKYDRDFICQERDATRGGPNNKWSLCESAAQTEQGKGCNNGKLVFCGTHYGKSSDNTFTTKNSCPLNNVLSVKQTDYKKPSSGNKYGSVKCSYKTDSVNTVSKANAVLSATADGNFDPRTKDYLIGAFCARETSKCNNDYLGKKVDKCLNYTSSDDATYKLCQEYGHGKDLSDIAINERDNAYRSFCNKNPKSKLCACIKPLDQDGNKFFDVVNNNVAASTHCWYYPCRPQRHVDVYQLSLPDDATCPSDLTICNNIIDISDSQNINLDDINQNTICTINDPCDNKCRSNETCVGGECKKGLSGGGDCPYECSFGYKCKDGECVISNWTIAIGILASLILLGVIGYFIFRSSSNNSNNSINS